MPRTKSAVEAPETAQTDKLAPLMKRLSDNYKAMAPFKAKLSPLEDEAKEIKGLLLPLMDAQGIKKTATKTESVSITETEGFVIDDIELMIKVLKREGRLDLLTIVPKMGKEYVMLKGKDVPGTHVTVVSRFIRVSGIKQV